MADRVLRGSRLGAVSYETDRNHDLAPRRVARYRTENGEEFDVPFADDAEIPGNWLCRNGLEGTLLEGNLPEPKKVKPPRTHWDMLLERRSVEELDELLKERLDLIKTKRRGKPAPAAVSTAPAAGPVKAPADAPPGHLGHRFANVRAAHFRHAEFALSERDRYLDHGEAVIDGSPGQVDLEAVTL